MGLLLLPVGLLASGGDGFAEIVTRDRAHTPDRGAWGLRERHASLSRWQEVRRFFRPERDGASS